ncbi:uncharacterized protein [Amphiura filiformis]|uniref:uncharacterized protein n=1 Tax=Amphiura filiformis TaxID=82378 RepID=UPI003B20D561
MDKFWISICFTLWTLLLLHYTAVAQVCNEPCQNGGICQDTNSCGQSSPPCCDCTGIAFVGMVCELPFSMTCNPNPCLNGGQCTLDQSDPKGYRCNCGGTGFSGQICERGGNAQQCTTTNDCNGATCTINGNCDCTSIGDYFGPTCHDKKALVGFEETAYAFRENEGMVSAYITRTFNTDITTTVRVTAVSAVGVVSATGNADYTFDPNPMIETFNPTDDRRKVEFQIINENVQEADEYFDLELSIDMASGAQARVLDEARVARIKIEGGDGSTGCNAPGSSPSFYECMNGGTCNVDGTCSCTTGYDGQTCNTVAQVCNPPCQNGGICQNTNNCGPMNPTCCDCTGIAFVGMVCELPVSLTCDPNPCLNGGLCTLDQSNQKGYRCNCDDTGYTGGICENIIAGPCTPSPCLNGGQCSINGNQFTCSCATGYTGTVCEDLEGPCSPSPCLNGGQCSINGNQFTCSCATGYTGSVCEVADSDPCNPNPCNGGICYIEGGIQLCDCTQTEFEGATCTDGGRGGQSGGLSTTATIIIAAIVAVFVVVIIIVVLVVFLKRRSNRNKEQPRAARETRDNTYAQRVVYRNDHGNNTPDLKRQKQPTGQKEQRQTGQKGQRGHQRHGTVYDKAERKIGDEFPRQKLKLHEHLGSGAFANVVRADAMGVVKRRVNTIVAVKMLKDTATESDRSDFMKELKVYRMLEPHPNIIVMLGCCTDEEPYYLIMEYAPHGNLQSHLRAIRNAPESPYNNIEGQRREFLTPNEILEFGSQIANGMKYLSSKQCIHRDLATRNVLLGDGLVCKLSDFGLARDISEQNSYEMQSRGRVPVRWMAIESLLENSYTSKSDVWSFGVTMWELVTVGSHPYPGMSSKK